MTADAVASTLASDVINKARADASSSELRASSGKTGDATIYVADSSQLGNVVGKETLRHLCNLAA